MREWLRRRFQRRVINGHPVRESGRACRHCKADPKRWCKAGCPALDVMDYR